MQFCSKCGGLLLPKKERERTVLVCSSCGCSKETGDIGEYRAVKRKERGDDVLIIDEDRKPALPTTKAKCPSCEHDLAYWWIRQTRAGDEPSTRFYKCVRCGKVWREYA